MIDILARFRLALGHRLQAAEAALGESPRALFAAILDLEHLLLSDILTEAEQEALLATPPAAALLVRSQQIFTPFETVLEKSFTALLLRGAYTRGLVESQDNITQNYLVRYARLAKAEAELASIRSDDHVLFIGSGPLPITAIEYVRQIGCRVDCVDCLDEAVAISSEVVAHLSLASQITSWQARGETVDCGKYDVILVGVLARPKAEIMANLAHTAKPECRIMCRTTYGTRAFIYRPTDVAQLVPYAPTHTFRATGHQTLSCMLLGKN